MALDAALDAAQATPMKPRIGYRQGRYARRETVDGKKNAA